MPTKQDQTLVLYINGKIIAKMSPSHLPYHTPPKVGWKPWRIVEEDTGKVVNRCSPPKVKRHK